MILVVSLPRSTADADVAAAYETESLTRCFEGARTGCVVALVLILAFTALDYVRYRELFHVLVRIRVVAVAVVVASLWLVVSGKFQRYVRPLAAFASITIGLMADALMLYTGGAASPFYAGAGLSILGSCLLISWRPAWSSLVSAVTIAGYIVCALPSRQAHGHLFLNNLVYLSGMGVIAIVTSAMHERLRWREFRARRALTDAYRHKSEFLANMSHELRTPIHVMIGYADILLEDALVAGGDEARRLVEGSRRQGLLLNRLISDLLDYSKIEAGKMEVALEPVALDAAVEETAESFRPVAERKGVRLAAYADTDLPELVSDRQKLQQILNNLVGNAIKFTDAGEIRIEATRATRLPSATIEALVVLSGDSEKPGELPRDGVVVSISDTGIGIQDSDLAKLAQDFQQVDQATAARYGGTGLGLSLSRKLVTLLGGTLAVRSRPGEGSTFAVFLPPLTPTPDS